MQLTQQEQQLINAIKSKPGYTVVPGSMGGSVQIFYTRSNGVSIQSVWLGRRLTIEKLQRIAAA